MSNRSKIGAGVVALAVIVVLFVVLSGGSDDGSDNSSSGGSATKTSNGGGAAAIPVIHLKGGEPVGGVGSIEVTSGDRVRFKVTSDIEGEVHVHGYDFEKPIKAGGSVSFDFPSNIEGAFEIEMHHGGGENTISDLKVEPG